MKYYRRNVEITLDEVFDVWMNNYQSIPFEVSPRYHRNVSFEGFCMYMRDRFDWRIK